LLGLGYPGGPLVEQYATRGDANRFDLPRPLKGRAGCDFSFSGLKTALRETAEDLGTLTDQDKSDLCASFQKAVAETMQDRLKKAFAMFHEEAANFRAAVPLTPHLHFGHLLPLEETGEGRSMSLLPPLLAGEGARRADEGQNTPTLVVAGGVAANKALRAMLETATAANGFTLSVPPFHLCTDNAAMIAWAASERFALGLSDAQDAPVRPRWPLDTVSAPAYGSGRLGAKA
jgi:N6-L-threonylcarbamoyladenine synthase